MSYEIRNMITFDGSGAYIKIGFRWYRLEQVSQSEHDEAEAIIEQRNADTLKSLGLKGPDAK